MLTKRPTLKQVRELKAEVVDLEVKLFQAEQFERIASDKLSVWVKKHDELLIKYKQLLLEHEPNTTSQSTTH